MLTKAMSILCEGRYQASERRNYIYQIIVDTLDATLDKLSDFPPFMEYEGFVAYTQLLSLQQVSIEDPPEWVQRALICLWIDPWVRECFRDYVESIVHPSAT